MARVYGARFTTVAAADLARPGDRVLDARTGLRARLPGPAPALGDRPGRTYFEIPMAIQDRSFNADGSRKICRISLRISPRTWAGWALAKLRTRYQPPNTITAPRMKLTIAGYGFICCRSSVAAPPA